jgi:hypothetical protein
MQEQSTHRCACSTRSAATAAVEPLRPGTNAVPITAGIALFHERLPLGCLSTSSFSRTPLVDTLRLRVSQIWGRKGAAPNPVGADEAFLSRTCSRCPAAGEGDIRTGARTESHHAHSCVSGCAVTTATFETRP